MILWKVILVTTATAVVAVSDLIQEQRSLNTAVRKEGNDFNTVTNLTTIEDDFETGLKPEQVDSTVGVMLVNNSGRLGEYEKKNVSDHLKTRAHHSKSCSPTSSCYHAGGHCFHSGYKCNGTIDSYGCLGGKHCLCCIPDNNATSCPVCPEATCAPHTTSPTDTDPTWPVTTSVIHTTTPRHIETTVAPSTTPKVTTSAIPTTTPRDIETTLAHSTAPPDISCPDTKVDAGQDLVCSRKTGAYTWQQAVDYCTSLGLSLAQPKHLLNVATKIVENIDSGWYWIGGKGTGSHQRWLNGTYLNSRLSVWESGNPSTSTSDCLVLHCASSNVRDGKILRTYACSKSNGHVICE